MNDVMSDGQYESDTSTENPYENTNIFDRNYRQMRQNPLYSSNSDLRRGSNGPVESPPLQYEDVEEDLVDSARRSRPHSKV